jgi:hypothetical protein
MQEDRQLTVARISAETSASAKLDEVCRWLIERQLNPMRLGVDHLPALGQDCWLRIALPITAPRAVLCTLWLVEDADPGGCLLAGHLRFVAHPIAADIRMSFSGRTAAAMRSGLLQRDANQAASQLLEVITQSIERPRILAPGIISLVTGDRPAQLAG